MRGEITPHTWAWGWAAGIGAQVGLGFSGLGGGLLNKVHTLLQWDSEARGEVFIADPLLEHLWRQGRGDSGNEPGGEQLLIQEGGGPKFFVRGDRGGGTRNFPQISKNSQQFEFYR